MVDSFLIFCKGPVLRSRSTVVVDDSVEITSVVVGVSSSSSESVNVFFKIEVVEIFLVVDGTVAIVEVADTRVVSVLSVGA